MKIALRFFIITYTVVILTTSVGAAILVKISSNAVFEELYLSASASNDYAARSFITLYNGKKYDESDEEFLNYISKEIFNILKSENIESVKIKYNNSEKLKPFEKSCYINKTNSTVAFFVADYCIEIEGEKYIVETTSNMSSAYINRENLWKYYRLIISVISLLSGVLLYLIAKQFSKPLNILSQGVSKITEGDYGQKIDIKNNIEEINTLTNNFNIMSMSIKAKTDALIEESEKRLMFISNFTHELKTPMTSIIGYADLLRRYDLESSEKQLAVEYIFNEGKRLEKLSMTLMEILLLNRTDIKYAKINLKEFLNSISNTLNLLSDKYEVVIKLEILDTMVYANETLLVSLIVNLTENACKASKKESTVYIRTEMTDGKIRFSVSDNGVGINRKDIERITEPFFMVDKSRTRKNGGAGLGLYLCKKITELHNTELEFYSRLNEGTTVYFDLKIAEE